MLAATNDSTKIRTASLSGVHKTLLLPLWGRAMESRKAKPLLVDRAAAAIAAGTHPITRLAWIARAIHIDRTLP
jgi:O-methyltransferase involved in polyketide biosynthesis